VKSLRVFLVEDESLIAMMVEGMLRDLGHQVAVSAASVREALHALDASDFDVALLDINIADEMVFPVADVLRQRRIPFAFASGYGATGVRQEFRDAPILVKPFSHVQLNAALAKACDMT
jgi:CheY-like chemotaxis protein